MYLKYFRDSHNNLMMSLIAQHAFRYGDPISVIAKTVKELAFEKKLSPKGKDLHLKSEWWLSILTTLTLLVTYSE